MPEQVKIENSLAFYFLRMELRSARTALEAERKEVPQDGHSCGYLAGKVAGLESAMESCVDYGSEECCDFLRRLSESDV